jgi:crotonobetainyl-CoA:carnitine CoA-transferase CaiB-like acyl-CoA transferase
MDTLGAPNRGALSDVAVLDLSRMLAGPYCTMLLGDLGANVIKIERFPGGDDARAMGPHVNGESYCFAMVNRNKRSVAVDLKAPAGRDLIHVLAKQADVVVENFRPGVTRRLGVDYDSLRAVNPALVYCSVTGFGQTGPHRHRAGYDIIAQGVSGLLTMTGQPSGEPVKVGVPMADLAAGAAGVQAILAAYIERLRSGEGQYIDLALVDCGVAWTVWEAAAYFGSGEIAEAMGTRHRRSAPYQAYRTPDGYVTIGANNDRLWVKLCNDVLDRPDLLTDDRFPTVPSRVQHADELEAEIEGVLAKAPTASWVEALDRAGVPGGPVLRYDDVLSNEQILARDMVVEQDHPRLGRIKVLGSPFKLSRTPVELSRPAPLLGQHTREVLQAHGLSASDLDSLLSAGVISEG